MVAGSYMSIPFARGVNELRSQIAYRDQAVRSLDPTCNGPCERDDQGGPTLDVSGVARVGRQRLTPQPRKNIRYQILDTFTYHRKSHDMKVGFDFSDIDHRSGSLPLHFGGRYIFAALPAIPGVLPTPISAVQSLALGLPAAYIQGYGNPATTYGYKDLSLFAQDEWKPGSDLAIKLGVRYQNQFWPNSQYALRGVGTYAFPSDNNNIAPRLAVSWNPLHDNGRTSVHGSYGIFYDNQLTNFVGVSNIINGSTGVRTLVLQFPAAVSAWNASGRRLPEPTAPYPSLTIVPDPNLKTPYAHQFCVGVNRELADRVSLAANLVYVRGEKLVGTLDYNPLVRTLGAGRRPDDLIVNGVPVPGTSTTVLQPTSWGETWYRGMTLSLTRRFSNRHQFLVSYTLSKAEDNSTDFQSDFIPQNTGLGRDPDKPTGLPIAFDPGAERGPSLQDQRHRVALSGTFVMPRDVQVSSIVIAGSGRPYNVLAGADLDGNGDGGGFPADRARVVPGDPATGIARNSGTLPWQTTVDVRVSRKFKLTSRSSAEGIFEVFNLFNRANFTAVDNIFGTGSYPGSPLPTFGQFQTAGPPRQAQLAVKVTF
jgi:hypothetical protein